MPPRPSWRLCSAMVHFFLWVRSGTRVAPGHDQTAPGKSFDKASPGFMVTSCEGPDYRGFLGYIPYDWLDGQDAVSAAPFLVVAKGLGA